MALMLGNIAHLAAGESGYKDFRTPSASNFNARFDALTQFVIGGSLYAFPKELLALMMTKSDFDSAQVVTMAVIGCYVLGNSVESLQAESFTQNDTRKNIYRYRIIECFSLTLLILLYWTFTDILTSHSLWAVPMYGILAVNASIAMNSVPTKMKE
ncbi:hypothetical protein HOLleu_02555 [Holothuria leucospilota]|uniref:Uncharacterized protein n=1 Tax=Holothuria leucospilota TaxID=206669 RepID=A0A9Q1CRG4_HOLLE|nr:hypothetical protein HOLleu_02555 [Holothuria leucospilota]